MGYFGNLMKREEALSCDSEVLERASRHYRGRDDTDTLAGSL